MTDPIMRDILNARDDGHFDERLHPSVRDALLRATETEKEK